MKSITRNLVCSLGVVAAGTVLFSATNPAAARDGRDTGANIKYMALMVTPYEGHTIHVVSKDRKKWDAIKSGSIGFGAKIEIDTKYPGYIHHAGIVLGACKISRVKEDDRWSWRNECKDKGMPVLYVRKVGKRDLYKSIDVNFDPHVIPVPQSGGFVEPHYGADIIAKCNQHLQADGPTKKHSFNYEMDLTLIAHTGRERHPNNVYNYPWSIGFANKSAKPTKIKYKVVCDPVKPPATLEVVASKLSAEVVNSVGGQCALKLVGTVTPTLPHVPVEFRYVDDTGKKSDVKTVGPMPGQVQRVFMHGYPLDHVADDKKGKIRIVGENAEFQSDWANFDMDDCSQAPGDFQIEQPPEIMSIQLAKPEGMIKMSNVSTTQTTGKATSNNGGGSGAIEYVCPKRVRLVAAVKGHSKMTGEATIHANATHANAKRIFKGPYQVGEGKTIQLPATHEFKWKQSNLQKGQEIAFRVVIKNKAGNLIDTYTKKNTYKCNRAANVVKIPLSIIAPKGVATTGQIKLGLAAKAGEEYKLRFFRKEGTRYKHVRRLAKLPKTMNGKTGSFNLQALKNAKHWRLEVCPAVLPSEVKCATSNFSVPNHVVIDSKKNNAGTNSSAQQPMVNGTVGPINPQ